ncbi:TrkH family potassium uptake protein [Cytobacillus oceanisediminis]|uniref:TrkH family potassium uptake protein n=1 Tax=Cytobacillus oceanisediminis TaxID=665099 RepID=UPI00203B7B2A|nr:TrkH family potassium uptake protein [Cytobacillus oceanisediminis]MCM3405963.1 TrkH family potassium uptake protein [Cytobacillus oceanisediminis]
MELAKNQEKLKRRLSSVQLIVFFYLIAVIVSTILLSLPVAHRPHVELSLIDALFTAVSAISVTGLGVVSTADTFSVPGYFILAFILQFGGIGIMTLGTFIWILFGKKIGLKDRQLIMTDQNRSTFSGLVKLMRQILVIIIIIELIGAIILGIHFRNYFPTWEEAFIQGFFASVSATTNAGFDITGTSLVPFAQDYFVQFINMILLILGAIGFPVLIEVKEFLTHKGSIPYKFTLFTKLTTLTFFILIVVGAVFIFLFDRNHYFADKSWHESLFYSLFQSISTRNGGLATMDVSEFSDPTLLFISGLMFIGASPSSVGGGIRTTTFAIMMLSIYFYAKGKESVKVFGRELHPSDIHGSFIVITTAAFICSFSIILMTIFEPSFSIIELVFEVSSAFGTTGLSMGITSSLSNPGKFIIMALMFIGRIGIFSFLFLIRGNTVKDKYKYPREKVIIG